jgi:hypothetical protein
MKNEIMALIYNLLLKNGEKIYETKKAGALWRIKITFQQQTKMPYTFYLHSQGMIHCYMDKWDVFAYKTMKMTYGTMTNDNVLKRLRIFVNET